MAYDLREVPNFDDAKCQEDASRVQWEQIYSRLERARSGLNDKFKLGSEEQARLLEVRARELAIETEKKGKDSLGIEVVEFSLAHERYAFELEYIRGVCSLKNLVPLPWIPEYVLGIINLKGRIVSVLDLKKFFELPGSDLTDLNRVIVLQSLDMEFGILADAILGVKSVEKDTIQASVPRLTDKRAQYLKGITPDRVVILDGQKLLSDRDIVVRTEVY